MRDKILKAVRETIVIGNPEGLKYFEKRLDEILANEKTIVILRNNVTTSTEPTKTTVVKSTP